MPSPIRLAPYCMHVSAWYSVTELQAWNFLILYPRSWCSRGSYHRSNMLDVMIASKNPSAIALVSALYWISSLIASSPVGNGLPKLIFIMQSLGLRRTIFCKIAIHRSSQSIRGVAELYFISSVSSEGSTIKIEWFCFIWKTEATPNGFDVNKGTWMMVLRSERWTQPNSPSYRPCIGMDSKVQRDERHWRALWHGISNFGVEFDIQDHLQSLERARTIEGGPEHLSWTFSPWDYCDLWSKFRSWTFCSLTTSYLFAFDLPILVWSLTLFSLFPASLRRLGVWILGSDTWLCWFPICTCGFCIIASHRSFICCRLMLCQYLIALLTNSIDIFVYPWLSCQEWCLDLYCQKPTIRNRRSYDLD